MYNKLHAYVQRSILKWLTYSFKINIFKNSLLCHQKTKNGLPAQFFSLLLVNISTVPKNQWIFCMCFLSLSS